MDDSFLSVAFDQFEDGMITRRVVIDLQAFACEFGNDLLDRD